MVSQSSTQACFSKQHLIIPKKMKCFNLWNIFLTFSCIIAVHQVPAAVNVCRAAACVYYLKNMIDDIKDCQNKTTKA